MIAAMWFALAVSPLMFVAAISACLARPDWVRALRSYVARVRWSQFQHTLKRRRRRGLSKGRVEAIMLEYYLYKGGGDVGERMTALREMTALGGRARWAAVHEIAESIGDHVNMLAKESVRGGTDRSGILLREVIEAVIGEKGLKLDDMRRRLGARQLNQLELLELLMGVQICLEVMPKIASIPPSRLE